MDGIYDTTIGRAKAQETYMAELDMQKLAWLTFACRPLSIMELLHTLSVESGNEGNVEDGVVGKEELISAVAGLTSIQSAKRTL
jgi:hypothetical protein